MSSCICFKMKATVADWLIRKMICCYNTIKYTGLLSNLLYMVRLHLAFTGY